MPTWLQNFASATHISPGSKAIAKKIGLIKTPTATPNTGGQLDIGGILQSIYGPDATNLQLGNLQQMLRGNFNQDAFNAANPGLQDEYNSKIQSGELNSGWTLEQYAKANGIDPTKYYGGGLMDLNSEATKSATNDQTTANTTLRGANIGDLSTLGPEARTAWAAANPELAKYTTGLMGTLDSLNGQKTPQVSAQMAALGNLSPAAQAGVTNANTRDANAFTAQFNGANAAQAGFTGAGATGADFTGADSFQAQGQRASGGPLLRQITNNAAGNLDRVTPIQGLLQQQAQDQLGTNGGLTAQDLYNVQQDTRGAYAARGLYDSNQAIGAEVLNTDAARRQRLLQNQQAAQAIDASGQQQIANNRNYALNAQGQGQNLSAFNTGQLNSLAQYNTGLLSDTSRYNAGQANQIGQFNAGAANTASLNNAQMANQQSQYNAGLLTNTSQYNAGQANQLGQYNAGLLSDTSRFNSGAYNTASLTNAGAANQAALQNAAQQNAFAMAQFNAQNQLSQYNSGLDYQTQLANAGLSQAANVDKWNRSMQYGGVLGQQAGDINSMVLGSNSNSQYMGANQINQGQGNQNSLTDLMSGMYNFNANAINASNISGGNNSAATNSGYLSAGAGIAGAAIIAF